MYSLKQQYGSAKKTGTQGFTRSTTDGQIRTDAVDPTKVDNIRVVKYNKTK